MNNKHFHSLIKCYPSNNTRHKAKDGGVLVIIKEPFNHNNASNEYEWERQTLKGDGDPALARHHISVTVMRKAASHHVNSVERG